MQSHISSHKEVCRLPFDSKALEQAPSQGELKTVLSYARILRQKRRHFTHFCSPAIHTIYAGFVMRKNSPVPESTK